MFFVKFINAFGDFVYPFLSLFLTIQLGYSPAFAASVVTVTVLLRIPAAIFGGTLADRWDKKGAYLLAQSTAASCILMCSVIREKHVLVGLLMISTFFAYSVKPILNAFVYDLAEDHNRKEAYSFLYLGINVGVAVGPLMAGFLFRHYLPLFFLGDALTSFAAVLLVAFCVHGPKKEVIHGQVGSQKSFLDFLKSVKRKPALWGFFSMNLLLSFLYAQGNFSLPLFMKEIYHNDSAMLFGTLMSINAITVVVTTTLITYFTRKQTLLFNIACAGVCLGVGFGILILPVHYWVFVLSTIIWTMGEILMSTNSGIYVVQNVEPDMRTRSSAFSAIVNAGGSSLGVFLMGMVITHLGVVYVWPITFVVGMIAFAGLRTLDVYGKKHNFVPQTNCQEKSVCPKERTLSEV